MTEPLTLSAIATALFKQPTVSQPQARFTCHVSSWDMEGLLQRMGVPRYDGEVITWPSGYLSPVTIDMDPDLAAGEMRWETRE